VRNRGRPSPVGQGVLRQPRPGHAQEAGEDHRVPAGAGAAPVEVLDAPLGPGLAALARMDSLGRRTGPAAARGDRLLVVLAPGTGEEVPDVLRWLGWSHLEGLLEARVVTLDPLPGPAPAPGSTPGAREGLADLPRLLDAVAHACACALLDGSLSRGPSRTPRGGGSAPGRGR
jgi:hypothetical protein